MNWDVITAGAEVIAAFAVVASLVYLARQVRQSSAETRINTQTAFTTLSATGFDPIYNTKEHMEIWHTGLSTPESLSESDLRIFFMFMDRNFAIFENMAFLHDASNLDPQLFGHLSGYYQTLFNGPGGQLWHSRGTYSLTETTLRHLQREK